MLKYDKYFYLIIAVISLGYVLLRSILLDITYDEAWTIDGWVYWPVKDIINYSIPCANNHMINSLLIKLFYQFGNESVFIARLPNVIASIFYFYFAYRISNKFFKSFFGPALFVLLVLNPFILDFFSLARGYGLAMTFLLGSIYYLLRFIEEYKIYQASISMVLGALSVLSNFTMLYFVLALIFVIYYSFFIHKWTMGSFIKLTTITSIITITMVALIYGPIRKLVSAGELWYGGTENFYKSTLFSLVSSSSGNKYDPEVISLVLNGFLIFFILIMILSFYIEIKEKRLWSCKKWKLTLLLFIPIVTTIMAHHIFGTKYLIDRTALFLIPLIMIALVILADEIEIKVIAYIAGTMVGIISILVILNFVNYWNLYTTTTWYFDSHTREIMSKINEEGKSRNKVLKLDSSWPFKSSIQYYQQRKYYENVVYVLDEPDNLDSSRADYYLHLNKVIANAGYYPENNSIRDFQRDTILFFEKEGIVLISNKQTTNSSK